MNIVLELALSCDLVGGARFATRGLDQRPLGAQNGTGTGCHGNETRCALNRENGEAAREARRRKPVSVRDYDGYAALPACTTRGEPLQRPTEGRSPLPRCVRDFYGGSQCALIRITIVSAPPEIELLAQHGTMLPPDMIGLTEEQV